MRRATRQTPTPLPQWPPILPPLPIPQIDNPSLLLLLLFLLSLLVLFFSPLRPEKPTSSCPLSPWYLHLQGSRAIGKRIFVVLKAVSVGVSRGSCAFDMELCGKKGSKKEGRKEESKTDKFASISAREAGQEGSQRLTPHCTWHNSSSPCLLSSPPSRPSTPPKQAAPSLSGLPLLPKQVPLLHAATTQDERNAACRRRLGLDGREGLRPQSHGVVGRVLAS